MAGTPKNAAPQFVNRGIKDNTRRQIPNEPMQLPTHLPFVLVRSSQGPENDQLAVGGSLLNLYGRDLFDQKSPYFAHQNYFGDLMNARGNSLLVCRIVPRDAPAPAAMGIWIDVVKDKVPEYELNSDGSYTLGADGGKVPTGQLIDGHRYRLFVESLARKNTDGTPADNAGQLGQSQQKPGILVSESGEESICFPLFEMATPFRGKPGNRRGFRLSAPTMRSADATIESVVEDQSAFLYRIQMVERPDDQSGPQLKSTVAGESSVMFSFKDSVYDTKTQVEYGIRDVLMQAYNAASADGGPETFGTFSSFHVYEENMEEVLKMLHAAELPYGGVGDGPEDFHMFNFLNGVSYLGNPYQSVIIEGPSQQGVIFSENSTYYALDGGDGTLTEDEYDAGVAAWLDGFENSPYKLTDELRVPMSCMYDSGFSLSTKLKFPQLLALRDDIYLVLSTQDYNEPQNTEEEDYSIGVALKNALRSYPESVLYGTGVVRGIIMGHGGKRFDTKMRGTIPLTSKFADDCANYMGRGDAIWNSSQAPDEPGNNVVTGFESINVRTKTDTMRDRFWEASIVWAQYKDRRDVFIPAYQTVYDDDTSVLNSAFNMIIAVDIIKVCRSVWTDLTGRGKFRTREQFVQKSNELIALRVRDRYDGRVTVVPNTYFTEADITRGYSWSCDVNLYMNGLLTMEQFTVIANRTDDLEIAA